MRHLVGRSCCVCLCVRLSHALKLAQTYRLPSCSLLNPHLFDYPFEHSAMVRGGWEG